ncbi:MAG: ACP phosphodiesterase [Pseudomonadales bacterium]
MNFLAHCLIGAQALETEDPALIAGGFLGDFIKGRVPEDLPADLALGVRLHRRIDAYSNQHPGIRTSCARFPRQLRRMAPIFVDIIADHCLARRWSEFSDEPITSFTTRTYQHIGEHAGWLTTPGKRFFRYMIDEDLLASYLHAEAMHRGLRSITRRLDKEHLNSDLSATAIEQLEHLEIDFLEYFPDMLAHARSWVEHELR